MKFKELLEDVTWSQIEKSLIRIFQVTPYNLESYKKVVQKLLTMTPKESSMRICITWVPPNNDFIDYGYWCVHGKNGTLQKDTDDFKYFKDNCSEEFANSEVTWGLEFNEWCEFLGMSIDPETVNNIELSKSDIVAHILYEMTFMGYNEEEIQEKANELKRRADEVKNMSEEELKKNTYTIEEFKEKLNKLIDEKKSEDEQKEI